MSRTIDREIGGDDWRLWPVQAAGADWTQIFAPPVDAQSQLHVDIGFGGGEFLVALAERHPERAYVGIELGFDRVLKLTRHLSRTPIRNIRLIGTAAEWAVREAFEEGSVSTFWIIFPDPWPKRNHRRRRLIQPRFVHALIQKLVPGGSLMVATDDAGTTHSRSTQYSPKRAECATRTRRIATSESGRHQHGRNSRTNGVGRAADVSTSSTVAVRQARCCTQPCRRTQMGPGRSARHTIIGLKPCPTETTSKITHRSSCVTCSAHGALPRTGPTRWWAGCTPRASKSCRR